MADRSNSERARDTAERRGDARVPHPSWLPTLSGTGQDNKPIVNPDEFWSRLGI
jgi:hypothetical protein